MFMELTDSHSGEKFLLGFENNIKTMSHEEGSGRTLITKDGLAIACVKERYEDIRDFILKKQNQ